MLSVTAFIIVQGIDTPQALTLIPKPNPNPHPKPNPNPHPNPNPSFGKLSFLRFTLHSETFCFSICFRTFLMLSELFAFLSKNILSPHFDLFSGYFLIFHIGTCFSIVLKFWVFYCICMCCFCHCYCFHPCTGY